MTIDLRHLWRLAWERRRQLIPFHAAVGVIALAVALLQPRWYTSSATLVPAPEEGLSLDFSGLQGGLGGATALGAVATPQDQLRLVVRSRAVADSIIQRFDLVRYWRLEDREQAREKLAEHVTVSTPIEGQVVVVVEARSAILARDMAVAYASCAGHEVVRLTTRRAAQHRVYLESRLRGLERDIAVAAARVREFEEKTGAFSLAEQARETRKTTGSLRAQVAVLETELAVARRYFAASSQPVVMLRDRIDALRGQIDRLSRGGGPMLSRGGKLPALKQQHLELTREQASLTAICDILRRVYEQARVEEASPVPTFSVLDAPDLPERPSRPRRAMTVCIAVGLSLVFSVGFIQWQEMRAGRGSPPDVRSHAQPFPEVA